MSKVVSLSIKKLKKRHNVSLFALQTVFNSMDSKIKASRKGLVSQYSSTMHRQFGGAKHNPSVLRKPKEFRSFDKHIFLTAFEKATHVLRYILKIIFELKN